jgi:hypothetical protein
LDEEIKSLKVELLETINGLSVELENMKVLTLLFTYLNLFYVIHKPNLHASEKYDSVMDKVQESSEELENCKNFVNVTSAKFEDVKKERLQLFQVQFTLFGFFLSFQFLIAMLPPHLYGFGGYLSRPYQKL